MRKFKFLLWGGLALTMLMAGVSSARAVNAARHIAYELHPQFAGLDSTGLVFDLDVSYRNDTAGQVRVHHPRLEVYHGDSLLGLMDLTGKSLVLLPKSSGKLSDREQLGEPLRISIPLSVIREVAPSAISAYLGFGPALKLKVRVQGQLVIPWVPPFKFRHSEEITLEKPA